MEGNDKMLVPHAGCYAPTFKFVPVSLVIMGGDDILSCRFPAQEKRKFTSWAKDDADVLKTYFRQWIKGRQSGYPGNIFTIL